MNAKTPHECDSPPFNEAFDTFRKFLTEQGVTGPVQWIWRDAIISRRVPGPRGRAHRRIFIDVHRLVDESEIQRYYEIGVARNLGIALSVFCLVNDAPMCYVSIPEDETAAEYAMMAPLKCSIPSPCPTGSMIKSRWIAWMLRLIIRIPPGSWANEVPCRPVAS